MSLADTARRLIAKHGRTDGALRRPSTDNTVASDRPWTTTDSNPAVDPLVAQNIPTVVLDARATLKPGTILPEQTSVAYMDADQTPRKLDLLETNGDRFIVLEVEVIEPGETRFLCILHLKAS